MKKLIFCGLLTAILGTGAFFAAQPLDNVGLSELQLTNIETLASSEKGCRTRPDSNDGNCTTDGTYYFCENSIIFKNCVKGEY